MFARRILKPARGKRFFAFRRSQSMKRTAVLNRLIEIGRDEASRVFDPAEDIVFESSGINRAAPDYYENVCEHLSKDQILHLFKGLVIAEKEYGISGGSVAGNIWVLRIISKRLPPFETYELIKWTLEHRGSNTYTPFGSMYADAVFAQQGIEILSKCKQDYLGSILLAKEMYLERRRSEKKKAEDEANQLRAQEKLERAKPQIHDTQRSEWIKSEIQKLSTMHPIERLDWLVKTEMPFPAIPQEHFNAAEISSAYQGYPDLASIEAKLGNHKKHWKKLLSALRAWTS